MKFINALSFGLHFNGASIPAIATHLGLSPRERRLQVKQLLVELKSALTPIKVLLGDLNEWFLWRRPLRWLHRHFATTSAPATFPSRYPILALDRIWAQPSQCV
ncbi:MAG: hypothetical protein PVF82_05640 [Gammaproteobacteria bacterium]